MNLKNNCFIFNNLNKKYICCKKSKEKRNYYSCHVWDM